ncbi:MAG: hypothetical protein KatS3mg055_0382 [Chloroflexus sp.]|nr:MAG: hypothetical protein KatS3mg055_0382 [Chloroflexus sp.]
MPLRGGVLCVNTFAPLRYGPGMGGTAPPCPYGGAFCASTPLRLCVNGPGMGGTAPPCPDGGRSAREGPPRSLRLCALCAFALASFAPLRYGPGMGGTAPLCPDGGRPVRQHLCAFACFAPLRYGPGMGGTAPPCPYGGAVCASTPLRLCALCAFALTVLAWGARHRRAPTGGVLHVRVLRALCAFAPFAPLR